MLSKPLQTFLKKHEKSLESAGAEATKDQTETYSF